MSSKVIQVKISHALAVSGHLDFDSGYYPACNDFLGIIYLCLSGFIITFSSFTALGILLIAAAGAAGSVVIVRRSKKNI